MDGILLTAALDAMSIFICWRVNSPTAIATHIITLTGESLPIHQNTKSPAWPEPVEGHKKVPAATKCIVYRV